MVKKTSIWAKQLAAVNGPALRLTRAFSRITTACLVYFKWKRISWARCLHVATPALLDPRRLRAIGARVGCATRPPVGAALLAWTVIPAILLCGYRNFSGMAAVDVLSLGGSGRGALTGRWPPPAECEALTGTGARDSSEAKTGPCDDDAWDASARRITSSVLFAQSAESEVGDQLATGPLRRLMRIAGEASVRTARQAVAVQKSLLRPAGLERWELGESPRFHSTLDDEQKRDAAAAFQQLGMTDAVLPVHRRFDVALVMGATAPCMRRRFAFLLNLISSGRVEVGRIDVLAGRRTLTPAVETEDAILGSDASGRDFPFRSEWMAPESLPTTETGAAELIVDQADLPAGVDRRRIRIIDSLNREDPRTGSTRRPTTHDTLVDWMATVSSDSLRVLVVSSNPTCGYQHAVVESVLPRSMQVETVGPSVAAPGAGGLDLDVMFDSLGRWLYQFRSV